MSQEPKGGGGGIKGVAPLWIFIKNLKSNKKKRWKTRKNKRKMCDFYFYVYTPYNILCINVHVFNFFPPTFPLIILIPLLWKFLDPCLYEVHFVSTVVLDGDWCHYIDLLHVAEHSPSTDVLQYLTHTYLVSKIHSASHLSSFPQFDLLNEFNLFEWVTKCIWKLEPQQQQI